LEGFLDWDAIRVAVEKGQVQVAFDQYSLLDGPIRHDLFHTRRAALRQRDLLTIPLPGQEAPARGQSGP